jgi:nucleoside-diphosphate-sugar epimerase
VLNAVSPEIVTAAPLAELVARETGRRPRRLSLPNAVLAAICGLSALGARIRWRPTVLAHGKWRELVAPGWVADATRLRAALGPVCGTGLPAGLAATAAWYRRQGWLPAATAAAGQAE